MAIRLIRFTRAEAQPIRLFESAGAFSVPIADGSGEAHAYAVHFEPGGLIGSHPAGFDQLFLVAQGSGWVSGSDGVRHPIGPGEGAFIPRGETHSKGSDSGMLAVMLQASRYQLAELQQES